MLPTMANKVYTRGMSLPNMSLSICPFYCEKFRTAGGLYMNKNPKLMPGLCFKQYEDGYYYYNDFHNHLVTTNNGLFEDCDYEKINISLLSTKTSTMSETMTICKGLELNENNTQLKKNLSLMTLIKDLQKNYPGKYIRLVVLSCTIGTNNLSVKESIILNSSRKINNSELKSTHNKLFQNNYVKGKLICN